MIVIDAPHFFAAVVIGQNGRVERAAPILKYMVGWKAKDVIAYASGKGWKTIDRRER